MDKEGDGSAGRLQPFWALTPEQAAKRLDCTLEGLTSLEAQQRFKVHGSNEIARTKKHGPAHIALSQFSSPVLILLLVAAAVAYALGEHVDAIVITLILMMSASLGFFQEYRAERALAQLKKYLTVHTRVVRDGMLDEIDARNLVPGDIVHLTMGDIIPADLRLISADGLATDEATLTGESRPVIKAVQICSAQFTTPQQLVNITFMGTAVSEGSAQGIVIRTGNHTFFGQVAKSLGQERPQTGFQKNMTAFSSLLVKLFLAMAVFIFFANALLHKGILTSLLFALALAVGITPELLPIIITVSLARGALRMARENVIIKRLISVEDVGNIDILCSDKTGTLTEGEITFIGALDADARRNEGLLVDALLCNTISRQKSKILSGNSFDKALWKSPNAVTAARKLDHYQILGTNTFDFRRKRMSVLVLHEAQRYLIVKGASESVLSACTSVLQKGRCITLTSKRRQQLQVMCTRHEQQGYSVLGMARSRTVRQKTSVVDERDLMFLGFLLFFDPPKKTAAASLHRLQNLGIEGKIISGDSPVITRKICGDVGLAVRQGKVMTGDELDRLTPEQFRQAVVQRNVFARCTPEHKQMIVRTLREQGHVVGFLGDGINDVSALREADVGISVDSGAGVAKESSDIILLTKSLRVIADGIVEGRKTFGNIMKYILNTMSANLGNMVTVAISSLFLPFIPLLPSQILLTNFLTDIPLITLPTDSVDSEFLKKPKRWDIHLISRFMLIFGIISTVFDLVLILPLLFILHTDVTLFRTAWFVESVLSEIIITFAIRTRRPFSTSIPSMPLLFSSVAVAGTGIVLPYVFLGVVYFSFVPLILSLLAYIIALIVAYFLSVEIAKFIFYRIYERQGQMPASLPGHAHGGLALSRPRSPLQQHHQA